MAAHRFGSPPAVSSAPADPAPPTAARTGAWARLELWLPPLLLMGAIFALSAQPDLNSGLGTVDQIGRKVVHVAEYTLLCLLVWRAVRAEATALVAHASSIAIGVSIAYACTDEFHQHFVRGRHGDPVDVCIDAVGAGLAAFLIRRRTAAGGARIDRLDELAR